MVTRVVKTRVVFWICVVVGLTAFFIWTGQIRSKETAYRQAEILQAAYWGRVDSKRIDTENHNLRIVRIHAFTDSVSHVNIILPFDTTVAFSMIQIGDTLLKFSGDSSLLVLNGSAPFKTNLLSTTTEQLSKASRKEALIRIEAISK
jgi:hypothetical protein